MSVPVVRPETPADIAGVRFVNTAAFPTTAEADLVDEFRTASSPVISLVAAAAGDIVGHILFSPVTLPGQGALKLMGLAPMAVLPAHQKRGVGAALVREGVAACRTLGAAGVVVLGHPAYYPRFGFVPASRFGLSTVYDAPDEAFLALELMPGALKGAAGRVSYHPAFARFA